MKQRLLQFLQDEAGGGLVLIAASALALIVANSPLAALYTNVLRFPVGFLSLHHWINEGLMTLFFLLVGLEIKQEFLFGELSTPKSRLLPGIAALGGMVLPALIFIALTHDAPAFQKGWAIPCATDIAFALGILSLLGSRVPLSLKIFLTALAILDDLGAILIIALFYSEAIQWLPLAGALAGCLLLFVLNRRGVSSGIPYGLVGLAIWVCMLDSGIHATLAGVLIALWIPATSKADAAQDTVSESLSNETSLLKRMEHVLSPWVGFFILPLFGFANAGVSLGHTQLDTVGSSLPVGIVLSLYFGKQGGVLGFVWLSTKLRLTAKPADTSWGQLWGIAMLCGIGFTMSIFIATLAYPESPQLVDAAKIGILAGSVLSALAGYVLLSKTLSHRPDRVDL